METAVLAHTKKKLKQLLGFSKRVEAVKPIRQQEVEKLYQENDFLEAYSLHTDLRVEVDPHAAIGGMWEEMGQHQFDFLVRQGLLPQHRMLDIGCGTLRGGRHYIRYLDPGNYYGIDISRKALDYGEQLVQQEGLSDKQPHLWLNEKKTLTFEQFDGKSFDYLLAQSVFTHLRAEDIEQCFQNIGRILHDRSVFYFTYYKADANRQTTLKTFCYPFSFFEKLADQFGFQVKDCSGDYNHPRGQQMAALRLR